MPNKTDAQILQVVCRQGRQDRLVDLIFAECRLVLFEAETPQPTPEIHNGVLTPQPRNHHSGEALFFAMTTMGQRRIPFWQSYASLRRLRTCRHIRFGQPSSLRKNLETEPMFSQVRVDFWRWIELWSLRSAVDYAATSLGMRIRL